VTPGVQEPAYAKCGDLHIGYQVFGDGPVDVVLVSGLTSNLDADFRAPVETEEFAALAGMARCIAFDKRGTGISDRVIGAPSLEERMEDVTAVMDAAGSERAVIYGRADGGAMSVLFAATYPDRTLGLVLANPRPRFTSSPDFPWGPTYEEFRRETEDAVAIWGSRAHALAIARRVGLEKDEPTLTALARRMRLAASPGAARALREMNADIDVRQVLAGVQVPTLVIHEPEHVELARYVGERIPHAEVLESPLGTLTCVLPEFTTFLSRVQADAAGRALGSQRVLATVLFTDLVASTQKAVELGPRWPELLQQHNLAIRREIARHRGREVDTAGDGFFASGFDGPARAIRCACAIRDAIRELGLAVRVGVHTGECDVVDGKLAGLAVVIGSRIAGEAEVEEVLVSGTVKDLVAGSGIEFQARGLRALKGLGEWPVYAVSDDG
jgi:pimeloyl-ACP methyl ester carboxylesterase